MLSSLEVGCGEIMHLWHNHHPSCICILSWTTTLSTGILEFNLSVLVFWNKENLWCINRRRQWHSTPVLLSEKSHGRRSLVGCSPWGHQESDTTERPHFHFSLPCIGEGNGNPLQCSCLENPRDGGAWWAAVYGVAQSRTRLKWLSSSSSIHLTNFKS